MTLTDTPREPKQDRSRETRDRILETTLECLANRGWQGTTTSVVADLSGVSRGALQHHFPTREDLVNGLMVYMYENRVFNQFAIETVAPEGADPFDYLVEQVLNYYASDHFKAALQIWTAATGNPQLREQMVPHEQRFARTVYSSVVEALDADVSDERTHRMIQSMLDLARGLGVADVLSDDSRRRNSIARFWVGEMRSIKRREAGAETGVESDAHELGSGEPGAQPDAELAVELELAAAAGVDAAADASADADAQNVRAAGA